MLYQEKSYSYYFLKLLRKHPNFQEDWLLELCRTTSHQKAKELLLRESPKLQKPVYQVLSKDEDPEVRCSVVLSPYAPLKLRYAVVREADKELEALLFQCFALDKHEGFQRAFLESHDAESRVRLIQSGMLVPSLADHFFSDNSALVRMAAVEYIKQQIPEPRRAALLQRFSLDKDPSVSQSALE